MLYLLEIYMFFRKLHIVVHGKFMICLVISVAVAGLTSEQAQAQAAGSGNKGESIVISKMQGKVNVPLSVVMNRLGVEDRELLNRIISGSLYEEKQKLVGEKKVIKHIRGDKGVKLAYASHPATMLPASTVKADPKILEQDRKRRAEQKKRSAKQLAKVQKKIRKKFRECTPDERGTTKTQTGPITNARIAGILETDLLFISPKMMVPNPKSTFGKYTKIFIIKPGELNEYSMAESLDVKCLPFRFRATKRMNFRHYGKDALKNFDENFLGDGTFTGSYEGKQ